VKAAVLALAIVLLIPMLILVSTPVASAAPIQMQCSPWWLEDQKMVCVPNVWCTYLDVIIWAGNQSDEVAGDYPAYCTFPFDHIHWNVTLASNATLPRNSMSTYAAHGNASFQLGAAPNASSSPAQTSATVDPPRPPTMPKYPKPATMDHAASTDSPGIASDSLVDMEVWFNVTWDAGTCTHLTGEIQIAANGQQRTLTPFDAFASALCAFTRTPNAPDMFAPTRNLEKSLLASQPPLPSMPTLATPAQGQDVPEPVLTPAPSNAVAASAHSGTAVTRDANARDQADAGAQALGVRAQENTTIHALQGVSFPSAQGRLDEPDAIATGQRANSPWPQAQAEPRIHNPSVVWGVSAAPTSASGITVRQHSSPTRSPTPPSPPIRPAWGTWRSVAIIASVALVSAAFALYQRLTRDEIDTHPTRRLIMDAVTRSPGTTAQAISLSEGIPLTTLLYHARLLAKTGRLATTRVGPARLLFPTATSPHERDRVRALRAGLARKLYEDGRLAPVSIIEATTRHGVTRSSVMEQLNKLAKAGLVTIDRTGQRVAYQSVS
jgi:DNA-binding transcriptional ArsR family regulator